MLFKDNMIMDSIHTKETPVYCNIDNFSFVLKTVENGIYDFRNR